MSSPAPRNRPHWLKTVLLIVVWGVAIGLTVAYDKPLADAWFALTEGSIPVNMAAVLLTQLIKLHIITLIVLLISMLDPRIRWSLMKNAVWVMGAQALGSEVGKHLFGRLRPDVGNWHTVFYGPTLENGSFGFPSGHATASFALAAIFTSYYPRWRWLFIIGGVAVAFARVHQGRHFFGDTVAGCALGWYLALWILSLVRRPGKPKTVPVEPQ